MKHKKTNKPHGIVRGMTKKGNMISEASWFEGKTHGLARMLYDDYIIEVAILRMNEHVATLDINRQFRVVRSMVYAPELVEDFNPMDLKHPDFEIDE